jgi:hypothetical protein
MMTINIPDIAGRNSTTFKRLEFATLGSTGMFYAVRLYSRCSATDIIREDGKADIASR